jgi:hypothetical protein
MKNRPAIRRSVQLGIGLMGGAVIVAALAVALTV